MKIFALTTEGKFFMETSHDVYAIEEFIKIHATNLKKVEVVDEEGNLRLFIDTNYFKIDNLIPEDESEIPF